MPTPPRHHRAAARATAAALFGLLVTTALACTGDDARAGQSAPTTAPSTDATDPGADAGYEPLLEPAPCPDPALPTERVTCWALVLPEDRGAPTERQVELPVLRAAPRDPDAEHPPVVVLHGGPGGSALRDWLLWTNSLDDLGPEVVLYDQRGSGRAVPVLDCPEITDALRLALAQAADPAREREDVEVATRRCRERLTAGGVDLDHYDTPTSTADLEDLRVALGATRLTLVGQSYGTRLALDYARTHPTRVAALVLDSVDPPAPPPAATAGSDAAIDRLLQACDDDPACSAAHPDLRGDLERALGAFDAAPRSVTAHPEAGAPLELTVTGDDLYAGLFAAVYDTEAIALVPSVLTALGAGDPTVLQAVASRMLSALDGTARGAQLSVECADRSTSDDLYSEPRSSTLRLASPATLCDTWRVEPVDAEFRGPVVLGAAPPALVLAGELDPVTPAAVSRRLADEIDAEVFVVPRGGHGVALDDPCALRALRAFVADPDRELDACTRRATARPFA